MRRIQWRWLALLWVSLAACAGDGLPAAKNLTADAAHSRAVQRPVVVFYYSHSCPYCREIEENYLAPMVKRATAAEPFLLRAVEVDSSLTVTDFDGRKYSQSDLARRHGATIVPQLRFFGPDGRELTEPLIGLTSRDFYLGDLESSLAAAQASLVRSVPSAARSPRDGG
jgi:thioredoxin-related protein